jgi:hypothetical protein
MILVVARDQTWAAMYTVAERLTGGIAQGETLRVAASQRRNLAGVMQGSEVWDKWTDYSEPVRKRRYFSKHWSDIQTVQDAASKVAAFLRERPDQAG